MKYLLSVFFLLSASFAFCAETPTVPNTFKEGDIVSAEKMNQNLKSKINIKNSKINKYRPFNLYRVSYK